MGALKREAEVCLKSLTVHLSKNRLESAASVHPREELWGAVENETSVGSGNEDSKQNKTKQNKTKKMVGDC